MLAEGTQPPVTFVTLTRARAAVPDSNIGLALFHLAIPHPPAIYSRAKGTLTAEGHIGYLDNVALADRTLGKLRPGYGGGRPPGAHRDPD